MMNGRRRQSVVAFEFDAPQFCDLQSEADTSLSCDESWFDSIHTEHEPETPSISLPFFVGDELSPIESPKPPPFMCPSPKGSLLSSPCRRVTASSPTSSIGRGSSVKRRRSVGRSKLAHSHRMSSSNEAHCNAVRIAAMTTPIKRRKTTKPPPKRKGKVIDANSIRSQHWGSDDEENEENHTPSPVRLASVRKGLAFSPRKSSGMTPLRMALNKCTLHQAGSPTPRNPSLAAPSRVSVESSSTATDSFLQSFHDENDAEMDEMETSLRLLQTSNALKDVLQEDEIEDGNEDLSFGMVPVRRLLSTSSSTSSSSIVTFSSPSSKNTRPKERGGESPSFLRSGPQRTLRSVSSLSDVKAQRVTRTPGQRTARCRSRPSSTLRKSRPRAVTTAPKVSRVDREREIASLVAEHNRKFRQGRDKSDSRVAGRHMRERERTHSTKWHLLTSEERAAASSELGSKHVKRRRR